MQPYNLLKNGRIVKKIEASNIREARKLANLPIKLGFFRGTCSGMMGSDIWEIRPLFI